MAFCPPFGSSTIPAAYMLRDEFTTVLAAGAVNNTAATPGGAAGTAAQNLRTVVDTGSRLSITSNGLIVTDSAGAYGNPGLWYGAYTRVPGLMLATKIIHNGYATMFGFDADRTGLCSVNAMLLTGGEIRQYDNGAGQVAIGSMTAGVSYCFTTILRAVGAHHFIQGGTQYPMTTLIWTSELNSTATVYPCVGSGKEAYVRYARIPHNSLWLPTPVASDSFARSDAAVLGSTNGLAHQETTGLGSGGSGKTWTTKLGTYNIATGKAQASV